jgi:tritrans,polycis-undecaprenyl-diphosphate synthase [geranylgeranyl-diphosphate specific]
MGRVNMRYHIGMIPDGNRRWAKERGLDPWEGHGEGARKTELFIEWCIDREDISEITFYGLSEENFKRPTKELVKLYELYEEEFTRLINNEKLHRERVRVNIISTNIKPIPSNLTPLFRRLITETKDYENKVLNMLIGYTGQAEILSAISSPLNRFKNLLFGLNEKDLRNSLKVKTPCDLIIRTGEESEEREARSGFLLWQSSYAEYYHIDKYFPDVTEEDFDKAWDYFINTRRRKGL